MARPGARTLRPLARSVVAATVVGASLTGVFPGAGGAPFPPTIVRAVPVEVGDLLPKRAGGSLSLGAGGVLRAQADARTSRVRVCAPFWFTALGVIWVQRGGGPSAARVAVADVPNGFGPTDVLESEGGPDPGTAEPFGANAGTGLLWTGGSRCARVALQLPGDAVVSDVRAIFVNSSGTAAGPGTSPRGPVGLPSAEAMTRRPSIVTREEWGANPRLMNCTPGVAPAVKMAFVHHTAGTNNYAPRESDDIVRSIYAYHTNGRGWCDIAYNFLVDRYGRVFEGRSGGMTKPVIGAAQQGFNTGSFSVSAIGDFSFARPTDAMKRALQRILTWRLDVAHLPPKGRARMRSHGGDNNRYPEGEIVSLPVIGYHRMTGYTACPGDRMVALISGVRDRVNAMGLPKIYRPRLSASELAPGARPFEIGAGSSQRLRWQIRVREASGDIVARLPDRRGQRLDVTWWPRAAPYPRQAGRYMVVLEATAAGELARTAVLSFTYKLGFIVR